MNNCPHCHPQKRKTHLAPHVEYFIWCGYDLAFAPIKKLGLYNGYTAFTDMVERRLIDLALLLHIMKADPDPNESKLLNRSLIFFREAKRRGLDIYALKIFNRYTHTFLLKKDGRRHVYEGIPLMLMPQSLAFDDKNKAKQQLSAHNLPVAKGRSFRSKRRAIKYGRTLGFPLVVKPDNGSLSAHATYPVRSEPELKQAVRIAKQFQPAFTVERFIPGDLYRATVIGKKHVFVCKKIPAHVVGDGVSTVKKLVEQKNSDPRRGAQRKLNATLHHIALDTAARSILERQGLTPASIPADGRTVKLHNKAVLSLGCDVKNMTDEVHSENKQLFRQVAQALDMNLVGIDFLCRDIRMPHTDQTCAVIEVNSLPYADMHQIPSHGMPDPVAKTAWNTVLAYLEPANKK